MNVISSGRLALPDDEAVLAIVDFPVLIVAADSSSFCLVRELSPAVLSGATCAEFTEGLQVAVLFTAELSAAGRIVRCMDGAIRVKFNQPIDIDDVLAAIAWAGGSGKAIRIPPIKVRAAGQAIRHDAEIPFEVQDISQHGARLLAADLQPGDEVTVRLGSLTPRKAMVRWTQPGVAGVSFAPALEFDELARWVIREQFGDAPVASAKLVKPAGSSQSVAPFAQRLIVIDPDSRRRAAICHSLSALPLHVEPFESIAELPDRWEKSGLVLIHDEAQSLSTIIRRMDENGYWLPVVGYSEVAQLPDVVRAMKGGALDYLAWPFTPSTVASLIARITPDVERISSQWNRRHASRQQIQKLTGRERQILKAMVHGMSNRIIAEETSLSIRTIETHRANIMRKLGAVHSAEAIRLAIDAGLDAETH